LKFLFFFNRFNRCRPPMCRGPTGSLPPPPLFGPDMWHGRATPLASAGFRPLPSKAVPAGRGRTPHPLSLSLSLSALACRVAPPVDPSALPRCLDSPLTSPVIHQCCRSPELPPPIPKAPPPPQTLPSSRLHRTTLSTCCSGEPC
jgi:hypothetical protein